MNKKTGLLEDNDLELTFLHNHSGDVKRSYCIIIIGMSCLLVPESCTLEKQKQTSDHHNHVKTFTEENSSSLQQLDSTLSASLILCKSNVFKYPFK